LFVKNRVAAASSDAVDSTFDVFEISQKEEPKAPTFADVLQQLNNSESPERTDEWMRFSCWQSFEKQWRQDNLSDESSDLSRKIDEFLKREAASYMLAQNGSSSDELTSQLVAKPSKLLFVDKTLERFTQEVYPQSTAIFGLENLNSVLQLASFGLSDNEIVQFVGDYSGPAVSDGASAADVAVSASKVDLKHARYMLRVIQANFQGALQNSEHFNEWIRSPNPPKKVVLRVEGTDDVMLLHALLSNPETGFARKSGDPVWSNFTYIRDRDQELRLCAEKVSHDDKRAEEERQGVLEKPIPFDLSAMKIGVDVVYKSKTNTNLTWIGISDNDLKASSIASRGTLRSDDNKV